MLRSTVRNFDFLEIEYPAAHIIGKDPRNLITKRPLDVFDVQNIFAANIFNKTVDFIILLRDIRSVITSIHKSIPDNYFIGHDYQYYIPPEGDPIRANPGVLPTYQAIVHLLKGNTPGKKIIIRYEDLVRSTTRTQAYLAASLRLGYRDRFENFYKADIPERLTAPLNKIDAPDTGRIVKWQLPEYRDRIRSQFTDCPALFDILVQTGYEKDRSWFDVYM
jgi:hypothetical protein